MKLPALDTKKILTIVSILFILLIILYLTGILPNQRCEEKTETFNNKEEFGACPAGDYTVSRAVQLGNKITGSVAIPSDTTGNKRALVNDNNKLTINYNNDFTSTEIDTGSGGLVIDGEKVNTNPIIDIIKGANTKLLTMDKDGNMTISKLLNVTGNTTIGAIGANKSLTVNGTLTATGATTLNNGLTVTGATNVAGLTATGATTLNNGLTVTGATNVAGLTATGATNVAGLTATGATTLNNGLTVKGASYIEGDTTIGTSGANKKLNVNGGLTAKGIELGPYRIWCARGGYLDAGQFTDTGTGVVLGDKLYNNNQMWYYNPITGVIKTAAGGRCLRFDSPKISLSNDGCSGNARATRFVMKDDKLWNQLSRTCLDTGNTNRSSGCTITGTGENANQGFLFEPY
jgi:hypothetical protein